MPACLDEPDYTGTICLLLAHRFTLKPSHFPRALFASAVSLTALAFGMLAVTAWRSAHLVQHLQEHEFAMERVCGDIAYLDEVLTMSASMAAATGDRAWETRYRAHVPELDQAIATAQRLAPASDTSGLAKQTQSANETLVALEMEAFALLARGEAQQAQQLLTSPAYSTSKQAYKFSNDRYLASVRERVIHTFREERLRARSNIRILSALAPLVLLLWINVWRTLGSYAAHRKTSEQRLRDHAIELETSSAELHQALRVKGEFLARMSHEIRTPMNGVIGIAGLLAQTELDEEQTHLVDTIVGSGDLLESILNDILDFSKIEAGMLRIVPLPCDLANLARDIRLTLQARAGEQGVTLNSQVAVGLPQAVLVDPVRIRQILLNLVGNAVKFTKDGTVDLRIEAGSTPDTLAFIVEDSGIGIAADRLEAVFQSFVQADDLTTKEYGGTGLGLTISRELTRAMGGTIEVSSELGIGTTFVVQLPAPPTEADAESPKGQWNEDWPASQSPVNRVLAADDNPVNQLVIRHTLEKLGCKVVVAADGDECLQRFRTGSFDLVLLDLNMPRMGGIEVARAIRALEGDASRTPLVACTASSLLGDVEACNEADMDGFLSKPLRNDDLIDLLHRFSERSAA